jgi:hypothetical protein
MLSLRAHAIICGSLFAALLMLLPVGAALQSSGLIKNPAAYKYPAMMLAGGLVLAFAFSAVPVMVKLVLGFQRAVGNQNVPAIRTVLTLENLTIWVIWGLMAAGLLIAVPAAIADGAFGSQPRRELEGLAIGTSRGMLVARPGMTVDEMVHGSSLQLNAPTGAPVISGGAVFDFRIPGSKITFPGCRYYFVSTFTHDRNRIQGMSIGTSHQKLTRAERDAADAELRSRLAADGWLTGHEVYRDEEDRQLHGGLAQGPEGRVWLKDGTVLTIESSQVDEVATGQDPETALVWIQAVSLWSADDYSGFDRFAFAPPQAATTAFGTR